MQWFLFDRIDAEPARPSIRGEDNLIVLPSPHEAKAWLAFLEGAEPRAEITLNTAVIQPMPVLSRHRGLHDVAIIARQPSACGVQRRGDGRRNEGVRPLPVAVIAGVLGPLPGADLLHLRDIPRISTGRASIGGAGTFEGVLRSGMVAAYLA